VLEKEATLLESVEEFQIIEPKCKEVPSDDSVDCQPSKKA